MRGFGAVLAALFLVASSARGQEADPLAASRAATAGGDHLEAWRLARAAYDPAVDDPAVLAALATAAVRADSLDALAALLDGVASERPAAFHALRVWGAVALRLGAAPAAVAARFDAWLADHPGRAGEAPGLVRVLEGHGAFDLARGLLDRARASGAPASDLALAAGELREAASDPGGALVAYLEVVTGGGAGAGAAAARAARLLDAWPADPPAAHAAERIAAALGAGSPADSLLVPLLARAYARAGAWGEARAALGRAGIGPEIRAAGLRSVARAALDAGVAEAAAAAMDDLYALGADVARPTDRLLEAEVAAARGEPARAAAAWEAAERAGVRGAGPRARLAAIEAARAAGDPAALAEAVTRARAARADPALLGVAEGDLWLARGRADSAAAAYARAAAAPGDVAVEALGRTRLVAALGRARAPAPSLAALGEALVVAGADPASAAERVGLVVDGLDGEEASAARSLLTGLAGEWRGRAGDPLGASAALEEAARAAPARDAPALLLAAGRWAERGGEGERARALWREVALEHAETPYALEARRLLAQGQADGR